MRRHIADVMKIQQVVVDNPFDQIERAPSEEHLPHEGSSSSGLPTHESLVCLDHVC